MMKRWFLTAVTPGERRAARAIARRCTSDSTPPQRWTTPPSTRTLTKSSGWPAVFISRTTSLRDAAEAFPRLMGRSAAATSACSRFARLTIPTTLEPRRIGTRLMRRNFFERRTFRDGHGVARHHVPGDEAVGLQVALRGALASVEKLEPPRSSPLGMGFFPAHQVALADDAEKPPLRIDHRHGTDAVLEKQPRDALNRRIGWHRDHVFRHHVLCSHRITPPVYALPKDRARCARRRRLANDRWRTQTSSPARACGRCRRAPGRQAFQCRACAHTE